MGNFVSVVFITLCAFGLFVWFDDQMPNKCEIPLKAFDTETTSV